MMHFILAKASFSVVQGSQSFLIKYLNKALPVEEFSSAVCFFSTRGHQQMLYLNKYHKYQ